MHLSFEVCFASFFLFVAFWESLLNLRVRTFAAVSLCVSDELNVCFHDLL